MKHEKYIPLQSCSRSLDCENTYGNRVEEIVQLKWRCGIMNAIRDRKLMGDMRVFMGGITTED